LTRGFGTKRIEACVPYATASHIRDVFEENKGPIDLDWGWGIFAQGGYTGYMSTGYEAEEGSMTAFRNWLRRSRVCPRNTPVIEPWEMGAWCLGMLPGGEKGSMKGDVK
jgi:hypothetical protein